MPSPFALSGMTRSPVWRHRMDVASRTLAGVFGGYALTAATTMFLSQALPLSRGTAVLTATMLSFAVYVCAVIWAFSVRSSRVWPGILVPTMVLGIAAFMLKALHGQGGAV